MNDHAIILYMESKPLAEVRQNLSRLVEEAVSTHARFDITRNGRRAAVLLSAEDFDSLTETLDVLADDTLVAEIREGMRDAAAGRTVSQDDLVEELRSAGKLPPR